MRERPGLHQVPSQAPAWAPAWEQRMAVLGGVRHQGVEAIPAGQGGGLMMILSLGLGVARRLGRAVGNQAGLGGGLMRIR